jgi:SAM-dependent methyltransferase
MRPIWNTIGGFTCSPLHFLDNEYLKICKGLLKAPHQKHRKQWEHVYIASQLRRAGRLKPGMSGISFGCGRERLVPAFANLGCKVLATDLHTEKSRSGWINKGQHAAGLRAFEHLLPSVCPKQRFYKNTDFLPVDMNDIPRRLRSSFDFVWSSCSLEHLGSLELGLEFVVNSAKCLRPGGFAVHTTEFVTTSNKWTVETGPSVYYRRRDLAGLKNLLGMDYLLYPFHFGNKPTRTDGHYGIERGGHYVTSIGIVLSRR